MAQINLLPWREKAREQKRNLFGYTVGAFIGMTVVLVLLVHFHYSSLITIQKKRNAFLSQMVDEESRQLLDLNAKIESGEAYDSELHFLMSLRSSGYMAISLLDELARITPTAIVLTTLSRDGDDILIYGKATSDYQITELMKNMHKSLIFNQPELTKIDSKSDSDDNAIYFQLRVTQKE